MGDRGHQTVVRVDVKLVALRISPT